MSFLMPVLYPSNVQEVIDFGLFGWAMSRFSGCWIGFKVLPQLMDASASISVDPERISSGDPGLRVAAGRRQHPLPDDRFSPEARCWITSCRRPSLCPRQRRRPPVAFGEGGRFGIVTAGKSYLDVLEAFSELGIDERRANAWGSASSNSASPGRSIRSRQGVLRWTREILVVEEKQPVIQDQLRTLLYHLPESRRRALSARVMSRAVGCSRPRWTSTPLDIARAIAQRLLRLTDDENCEGVWRRSIRSPPATLRQGPSSSACRISAPAARTRRRSRARWTAARWRHRLPLMANVP